jgi:dynein heavy chain 1, cytosolic
MENVDEIAMRHFPNINHEQALQRPILYSNWMDKNYVPVDREELRHYVKARSESLTSGIDEIVRPSG